MYSDAINNYSSVKFLIDYGFFKRCFNCCFGLNLNDQRKTHLYCLEKVIISDYLELASYEIIIFLSKLLLSFKRKCYFQIEYQKFG